MVDVIGNGYVMEYCISVFSKEKKDERYKYYMSDVGYILTNGFYQYHGAERPIQERYAERYMPKSKKKKEETADEIINRIQNGLKGL